MKDLIDECGKDLTLIGYKCKKMDKHSLEVCSMIVDSKDKERETGFEEGEYLVLNSHELFYGERDCLEYVSSYVQKSIKFLMGQNGLNKKSRFLIVGLGNPNVVADSLGSKVLEYVNINAYKNKNKIFKFAPNIFANTGINAIEVVGMLAVWLDIDGIIVIDSLATDCAERIACSIQLNSAGITPGSAVNHYGKKIGKSTLGLPCISIGVPLMFYGKILGKEDMLLTPKDIVQNVDDLALVIGDAINKVLL